MMIFLAELNRLELWATDIGNAFLDAYTKQKEMINTGPEFDPDLESHAHDLQGIVQTTPW